MRLSEKEFEDIPRFKASGGLLMKLLGFYGDAMSPEEMQSTFTLLMQYGFEAVIAGVIVFFLVKFFLLSYLSEKGKKSRNERRYLKSYQRD
ncbi:MAG: hypothetical protein U5L02_21265 [Rheinheimera sp.]|nr:hypothetical protein [Rheinheimera sp.]